MKPAASASESENAQANPTLIKKEFDMKTQQFTQMLNSAEFLGRDYIAPAALDLALHYAIPQTADQSDSEIDIPGYARVRVESNEENWVVNGYEVTNRRDIDFPTITRGKAEAVCLSFGVAGIIRRISVFDRSSLLVENRMLKFRAGDLGLIEYNPTGD